ncbi:MAG: hypothetical protein KGD73_05580 [Candidatus Lokiarchaeota archaeon]|nr:hypothetical protein [Candidatus Lokiarchaeota archaeon]
MDEKVPKEEYIIDHESIDDQLVDEEESTAIEEDMAVAEVVEEEFKKGKIERKILQKQKEEAKQAHKENLERAIIRILKKGTVMSKLDLTNLLIKAGITNYTYKINIFESALRRDIPELGAVLKKLRFEKKIDFSIYNGSHVFFTYFKNKQLKAKPPKIDFDWRSYKIPFGRNEIYMVFKIPGSNYKCFHFLSSCFPKARFLGFKINVDKKYEKNCSFTILKGTLDGYFDEDKLVLRCHTADENTSETIFKIYQIGRRIVKEVLMINRRYSEAIEIHNREDSLFIPVVPIFNAIDKQAFYTTKYTNVLRTLYDFPKKYEGRLVYGRFCVLHNNPKGVDLNIKDLHKFIEEAFRFQVKGFISNAILNDWIINPEKALNYTDVDDELEIFVKEYLQDIDTDRIIREKLESSMEKSEFVKDMTTNLLLTLLGLSILTDFPPFQWAIIGAFVLINGYYLFIKSRKSKKIFNS